MALVPTSNEFFAMVSVTEKPCISGEGNAVYMSDTGSAKLAALGCWKLEGKTVKVEWTKGDIVPNTFEFALFRPISSDESKAPPKKSKTVLTCSAPGWIGEIVVDRDEAGVLQKLTVAGEDVRFVENATSINFTFNSKNISLSTSTGLFNYETSGLSSFLNKGRGDVVGTGSCKLADATKKF